MRRLFNPKSYLYFLLINIFLADPFHSAEAAQFSVSNEFELQDALNTASGNGENDRINLSAGIYDSSIFINGFRYEPGDGRNLEIIGDPEGRTIIDGKDNVVGLLINLGFNSPGAEIVIRNITFRNGNGNPGGGLFLSAGLANVTIDNCIFDSNDSHVNGGATIKDALKIEISGSTFSNSTTQSDGSGLSISGNNTEVIIRDSIFNGNISAVNGGAIHVSGNSLSSDIFDTTVSNNFSSGSGGGIYISGNDIRIDMDDVLFTGNFSEDRGGAVFITGLRADVLIQNNRFLANDSAGKGAEEGGGLYIDVSNSTLFLNANRFTGNIAGSDGAGMKIKGSISTRTTAVNNIFNDNISGGTGGAVYVSGNAASNITFTNNTFVLNQATGPGGGISVFLNADSAVSNIFNNIFFENNSGSAGNDIYVDDDADINSSGARVRLFNNIFSQFTRVCGDVRTCSAQIFSSGNNSDSDPLFSDIPGGDFSLKSNSPAIDAGDPTAPQLPAVDFNGNPRIKGSFPDLGAIETGFSDSGGSGCSVAALGNNSTNGLYLVFIPLMIMIFLKRCIRSLRKQQC